ncbi:preprotein translocase subunit YajC [Corallococcus exiguus]|uniref:Sec translocon accessory complex subunit YajC n=2 Tax=Corallococcus TaxID=83461 RepID=A0A3A8KQE4_9BACT|nr:MULTISPECIES: preprotein translocase subunit YajC [Corallococcus]NNC16465.1 preprotein translocase subunit YajC [Corallococcus exiguus]NOK19240.1 preprotein translocase subunit YajC [Corallococcus carmarthensis]NRD56053.1 preprotein translocase subunit YajC [Corallococcus exiguus]NRD63586.1 preprotein translocase subunit YajC [Corallococcus exiguus]RKH04194.1 preprotein translocase subunit YajC [Corallococcus carmarthensis]
MADSFLILAQAGAGSPLGTFGFLAVLVAIMYFVMIRPQQKQLKEHRNLLAGLKKGDDVVTSGGILGRIHQVDDSTVTLEIASGVRVRVLKTAVSAKGTVPVAGAPAAAPAEKKEEK